MVHVGVRKQDQVDVRQLLNRRGNVNQPLNPDRHRAEVQTNSCAEDWIRKNRKTVYFQQYGAMPKPRRV
jgi:hypothetical protein